MELPTVLGEVEIVEEFYYRCRQRFHATSVTKDLLGRRQNSIGVTVDIVHSFVRIETFLSTRCLLSLGILYPLFTFSVHPGRTIRSVHDRLQ